MSDNTELLNKATADLFAAHTICKLLESAALQGERPFENYDEGSLAYLIADIADKIDKATDAIMANV